MSKNKKNNKAENPELEQPQVEEPQIEQPEAEQEPEAEAEAEPEQPQDNKPAYVKELLEKGAVVIFGRTEGELNEMMANIPSDIDYIAGTIGYYIGKGLYRIQLNLK